MRYRRARLAGGSYFFTVNLSDRRRHLLVESVDLLRAAIRDVKRRHPFHIDAMVILPDHLHAIWTLPPGDSDFPTRWMLIKAGFTRRVAVDEPRNASRTRHGERGLWQRRYWEHAIRDDDDYAQHVAYIHYNPVKHGHTQRAADWPYSSIHRYIAEGLVDAEWGTVSTDDPGEFGESR